MEAKQDIRSRELPNPFANPQVRDKKIQVLCSRHTNHTLKSGHTSKWHIVTSPSTKASTMDGQQTFQKYKGPTLKKKKNPPTRRLQSFKATKQCRRRTVYLQTSEYSYNKNRRRNQGRALWDLWFCNRSFFQIKVFIEGGAFPYQ